jgi:hypothetical protein
MDRIAYLAPETVKMVYTIFLFGATVVPGVEDDEHVLEPLFCLAFRETIADEIIGEGGRPTRLWPLS